MKNTEGHLQDSKESQSSWQFYCVISAIAIGILMVIMKGIGVF